MLWKDVNGDRLRRIISGKIRAGSIWPPSWTCTAAGSSAGRWKIICAPGLPLAALRMAISARRPGAGLIHHSDRGVNMPRWMQSAGFHASMSRRADCYDNAPMESFFHTLKTKSVIGNMQHESKPDVTSSPPLKASTTEPVATPPSAISARSRWS